MNDNIFRILAILIFLVGAGISSYFRKKADRETGEKVSLKEEGWPITIALRVIGITLWLCVFAWMINPQWMSWSRGDLPDWARWLGVLLGVLSLCLAYWVFSTLGTNVTPTVSTRTSAQLVTRGPYRWIRHPLYVMGLLSYLGFALLAENWFIALLAVLVFIILRVRTTKEETKLVEKFGDEYRVYMQRTGRFVPRLN
jgi:protein-S-isoprenylcysteine O-methyltransferase Ste14